MSYYLIFMDFLIIYCLADCKSTCILTLASIKNIYQLRNFIRMESNLKNSIYLREANMQIEEKDEPFNKTQEIMKEDHSAVINESARKRSMKYHQFEKTMMSKNFNSEQFSLKKTRETNNFNSAHPMSHYPQAHIKHKNRIFRPCQDSFKNLIDKYNLHETVTEENPKAKATRDMLSKQHEQRKAGKMQSFKANLLKRIQFQVSDEIESSIQEQIIESGSAKEAKVQNFLKRQEFFAQQKQIMREMREFCTYGVIKIN